MVADPQEPVDPGDADAVAEGADEGVATGGAAGVSVGGQDALDPAPHATTTNSVASPIATRAGYRRRRTTLIEPLPTVDSIKRAQVTSHGRSVSGRCPARQ